ncbi:MAG: NAD(P)/FAD-dependent oxidoreductase [Betaproteobacteria bacterium]|nr:NAD(P)/FAD-dependent oxidoreductase [Betaproteobacteria bacterium]
MGSITACMARACEQIGVRFHRDSPVARIEQDRGRVRGVVLESGVCKDAEIIACNAHPRILADDLLAGLALPDDFLKAMATYRSESGSFRMNLALNALPRFSAKPEAGPHHASGIIMSPSLQWMEQAYRDAMDEGIARRPIVEMLIPSTVDDSLAPPGCHVASLFCQHFRRYLPGKATWDDDHKRKAVDAVFGVLETFAPGFRDSVIGYACHSPLDLERDFSLPGGDIFHGKMSLSQLWAAAAQSPSVPDHLGDASQLDLVWPKAGARQLGGVFLWCLCAWHTCLVGRMCALQLAAIRLGAYRCCHHAGSGSRFPLAHACGAADCRHARAVWPAPVA